MAKQLVGRVALVTGASRGIGGAAALRLAQHGATVAVHYGTDAASAEQTVEAIRQHGATAFVLGADLTCAGMIGPLFVALDTELAACGASGLDILVNNAGVGTMACIFEFEQSGKTDRSDRVGAVEAHGRRPHHFTEAGEHGHPLIELADRIVRAGQVRGSAASCRARRS